MQQYLWFNKQQGCCQGRQSCHNSDSEETRWTDERNGGRRSSGQTRRRIYCQPIHFQTVYNYVRWVILGDLDLQSYVVGDNGRDWFLNCLRPCMVRDNRGYWLLNCLRPCVVSDNREIDLQSFYDLVWRVIIGELQFQAVHNHVWGVIIGEIDKIADTTSWTQDNRTTDARFFMIFFL